MEMLDHIGMGFAHALSLQNLAYALVGCTLGTLIGILPGLGPLATIAMLLPFTYGLEPLSALIMLAGIYYGSQYGGSTTAILVNLPGETSSVVTMIDGHQMAKQGRAGAALAVAALSSLVGGTVGTLVLAAFAAPLASAAFSFGAAEYFSLMATGLIGATMLTSGSTVKAIGITLIGVLLGLIGTDTNSGEIRFAMDFPFLWDGIDFTIVAIGMFAIPEIVHNLEKPEMRDTLTGKISRLWPSRPDFARMIPASVRGTVLGSAAGVLPGAGLSIASFFSYTVEKRISRRAEEFGHGAVEGVAGPEAANNAAAQTAFIPTLVLGIPGSATMALVLGAMTLHNIQPGPQIMTANPALFWGLVASMWIGNILLVILNLPMIGVWVKLLKIPFRVLYPAILMFCCIGIYSLRSSMLDLLMGAGFGVIGYAFRRLRCDPAPLMLGLVLGPMMEENFRRALVISDGSYAVFVTRPISAVMLSVAAGLILLITISSFRRPKEK